MKYLITFLLMLSLTASTLYGAPAKESPAKEIASAPVPAPAVPKMTEADRKKLADKRKRVESKITELNGSKWELSVTSSDPKRKAESDTFTFQDGQFSSKNLSKRGFLPTNYTITVPDSAEEQSAVWETMQTGKEGIAFVRGEWKKDSMAGIINEQLDGGKKIVESQFTTKSRVAIPPSSKEEKKKDASAADKKAPSDSATLVSKEVNQPINTAGDEVPAVAAFVPGTVDEEPTSRLHS